jgi:hypothetical protein
MPSLAPNRQESYLFFLTVVGAVVPIINLPGVAGNIALSQQALAAIYLGQIKKWNDPLIQSRGEHSRAGYSRGSSLRWQRNELCLDRFVQQDQPCVEVSRGSSLEPKWSTGRGAEGNEGWPDGKGIRRFHRVCGVHLRLAKSSNFRERRQPQRRVCPCQPASTSVAAYQASHMGVDFKISIADAPGTWRCPPT